MNWCSVDKAMPKIFSTVRVKNDCFEDRACFIEDKNGYYFCIGDDVKQPWTPTHWKYLMEGKDD